MRKLTRLVVLGSGSKGNSFALIHGEAILLMDAGFPARELERRLTAARLDPAAVVAIAVTHEHGDHSTGAVTFARRHRVPVSASPGTWRAMTGGRERCEWLPLGSRGAVEIGPFRLDGCPTPHDAAEPLALGVTLPDSTTLALATDVGTITQGLRWFLRDRHCLIIEANHDPVMLRESDYPVVVKDRIASNDGHLSNHACAALLTELHHPELHLVVLAHRSRRCNTAGIAESTIRTALAGTGFKGELHLAEQEGPMPAVTIPGPVQSLLQFQE